MKRLTRARKITTAICLVLLTLIFGQPVSTASAQETPVYAVEYPFGQGYQAMANYEYNMRLVLDRIGGGTNQWVIPAKSTESYNSKGCWCADQGFKIAAGVPGGGACDVATWFYHVAKDSGLLTAVAGEPAHAKIYGVPLPGVVIWTGRESGNLWIKNDNHFDVVIHWDLNVHPGYIQLWVDTTPSSMVPTTIQISQLNSSPEEYQPQEPWIVDLPIANPGDVVFFIEYTPTPVMPTQTQVPTQVSVDTSVVVPTPTILSLSVISSETKTQLPWLVLALLVFAWFFAPRDEDRGRRVKHK